MGDDTTAKTPGSSSNAANHHEKYAPTEIEKTCGNKNDAAQAKKYEGDSISDPHPFHEAASDLESSTIIEKVINDSISTCFKIIIVYFLINCTVNPHDRALALESVFWIVHRAHRWR